MVISIGMIYSLSLLQTFLNVPYTFTPAIIRSQSEWYNQTLFSRNKEPYVRVMQQTDVTKAVLGVSTELSPKPNKTWTVQKVIQATTTELEHSNEKSKR